MIASVGESKEKCHSAQEGNTRVKRGSRHRGRQQKRKKDKKLNKGRTGRKCLTGVREKERRGTL